MAAFRRAVVVAVLAIWCFPATSLAQPDLARPTPLPELVTAGAARGAARGSGPVTAEAAELGAREQQAQDLQDWRGGEGVYFYVGAGLLLMLIVVLLLVII